MSLSRQISRTLVCVVATAASTHAAPTLIAIPAPAGSYGIEASALSADGQTVVGYTRASGQPDRAFRWTQAGGLEPLTVFGNDTLGVRPTGVSADGRVIVGELQFTDGVRWSEGSTVAVRFGLPALTEIAGVSGDGSTTIGTANALPSPQLAFRAISLAGNATTYEVLGGLNPVGRARAFAVNVDGSIVVGESGATEGTRAFRWSNGSMQNLGALAGDNQSFATAVSSDGSVVVGQSVRWNPGGSRAFRWTASGMTELPLAPGGIFAYASHVSADGQTIAGFGDWIDSDGFHGFGPLLWNQSFGVLPLAELLSAADLDLTDWSFETIQGLSTDGSTIAGTGRFGSQSAAFVITGLAIPTPGVATGLVLASALAACRRR